MKKLLPAVLAAVAVISVSFSVLAMGSGPKGDSSGPAGAPAAEKGDQAIAYYFHGAFRCVTCTNMEKFAKEAVGTNFKDALASGRLQFEEVNVEERGNEHFVKEYQLYTKTLILSLVKDKKELRYKNLDKIWELARDKEKFMRYVAQEVGAFMKDVE